jgi:hypothetical protein
LFAKVYVITMPARVAHVHAFLQLIHVDNATLVNAITPAQLPGVHDPRAAATRSHLKALCMVSDDASTLPSLILEDDVNAMAALELFNDTKNAIESLPDDWDIMYLSRFHVVCEWDKSVSPHLTRDSGGSGTQAYVVNKRSASNLCYLGNDTIFTSPMMHNHIDMWLKQVVRLGWLESFASIPMLFYSGGTDECMQDIMKWVPPAVYTLLATVTIGLRFTRCTDAACIMLNWVSAVLLIVTLKTLLRSWPYPLAASALGFVTTLCSLHGVEYAVLSKPMTALLAALMACSIGLVNISLHANAVGTYELLKSLALPASATIQWAFYKEKDSKGALALVFATFSFIVLGTTVHPYGTSAAGALCGVAAAIANATEKSIIRDLTRTKTAQPLQMLKTTMPYATIALLLASAVTENTRWLIDDWYEWFLLLAMCILVVIVSTTAHQIVGKVGPTAYLCLATAKTLTVVTLFNSWGAPTNTVGIVGAAVFGALYVHFHRAKAPHMGLHARVAVELDVPSAEDA